MCQSKTRRKIWAGIVRAKIAMRLNGCGVMQGLIWGVMSTGKAVVELHPVTDFL